MKKNFERGKQIFPKQYSKNVEVSRGFLKTIIALHCANLLEST